MSNVSLYTTRQGLRSIAEGIAYQIRTDVPADATAGFAPGCTVVCVDGDDRGLWGNTGDAAACAFRKMANLDAQGNLSVGNTVPATGADSLLRELEFAEGAIVSTNDTHRILRGRAGVETMIGGIDLVARARMAGDYIDNRFYDDGGEPLTSGMTLQANRLCLAPIYIWRAWNPNRLGVRVTSGGDKARIGLFRAAIDGGADGATLVAETGELDVGSGSATPVEGTISVAVRSGRYWEGIIVNATTGVSHLRNSYSSQGRVAPDNIDVHPYQDRTYGAMPSTVALTGTNGTTKPQLLIRRVA